MGKMSAIIFLYLFTGSLDLARIAGQKKTKITTNRQNLPWNYSGNNAHFESQLCSNHRQFSILYFLQIYMFFLLLLLASFPFYFNPKLTIFENPKWEGKEKLWRTNGYLQIPEPAYNHQFWGHQSLKFQKLISIHCKSTMKAQ